MRGRDWSVIINKLKYNHHVVPSTSVAIHSVGKGIEEVISGEIGCKIQI